MPRSIDVIRAVAGNVGRVLGIGDDVGTLNLAVLLDGLTQYSITYDVLEEHEMPHSGVEACCIPEELLICIREDVYENACYSDPRARFTIIHEFGHLILGHRRTLNRELQMPLKIFEDSEWQANQFAAEFLMPIEAIKKYKLMQVNELQNFFNVSSPAAARRISQLKKRGDI